MTLYMTGLITVLACITQVMHAQIATQDHLDNLARNLDIKMEVVENLEDGSLHLFNLTIDNKANNSLSGTNWKLYFYSFFIVEPKHLIAEDGLSTLVEGYVIPNTNLRVKHENGVLFSFTPTENFEAITPNDQITIIFNAQNWAVSKSDIPPNWFLTVNGLSARVIDSTKENFVKDFTKPKQWKRKAADKYNPYSTQHRFSRYEKSSEHVTRKLIIPTPKKISVYDATTTLDLSVCAKVVKSDTNLDDEVSFLENRTTFEIKNDCLNAEIHLVLNDTISDEGYVLTINPASKIIQISGKAKAGIFYGIQSLLSLLRNNQNLPKIEIRDEPRFPYRGMHVDVARNFLKKSTLYKLMDAMAMNKMNKLHLHLTDDEGWRIEINGIPELTGIGSKRCYSEHEHTCLIPQLGSGPDTNTTGSGFYTIQDYKDILIYAKIRHIEIIPEIDMPGHARAAIMAMEGRYKSNGQTSEANKYRLIDPSDDSRYLSVQNFNDNAMDVCIESTYTFIEKVISEIKSLHKDTGNHLKIFHFGGDEVAKTAWVNSTACNNLNISRNDLKRLFTERVANITALHGLNMAGWEDGFNAGHGIPFSRSKYPNTDVYSNAWDNVWEWGESRRAYNFANDGYKVIMSHGTHLYFDQPYEPDPEERGLYWATRFTDSLKTFGFLPDSLYENIDVTRMGVALSKSDICGSPINQTRCPDLQKPENIAGIQGQLWSETVLKDEYFDYMVFPRLFALAERAWHKASWESVKDVTKRNQQLREDWDRFASTLGNKELLRLDNVAIRYRVPPPGVKEINGKIEANTAFPGLSVEHSLDNKNWTSAGDIPYTESELYLRTRSADGQRTSRVVVFTKTQPTGDSTINVVSIILLIVCLINSL